MAGKLDVIHVIDTETVHVEVVAVGVKDKEKAAEEACDRLINGKGKLKVVANIEDERLDVTVRRKGVDVHFSLRLDLPEGIEDDSQQIIEEPHEGK